MEVLKINITDFIKKEELSSKSEIDKTRYIAYYLFVKNNEDEFTLDRIIDCLVTNNFSNPNISRLRINIKKNKCFVTGKGKNTFRLHQKSLQELSDKCSYLSNNDKIESDNEFLDEGLFDVGRVYINKLVKQINCSYKNNLYDCCAVILRRLIEVLLILAYENLGISDEIKGTDGNYKMLEPIVANAKENSVLKLSRSKHSLDQIRDIGNLAAHKIFYNTRPKDIEDIKLKYRVIAEELLHKANLIK